MIALQSTSCLTTACPMLKPIDRDFISPIRNTQVGNVCPTCHQSTERRLEGLPLLPRTRIQ